MLAETRDEPFTKKGWIFELKLDGYRAVAFARGGQLFLRSRNDNDFNRRYARLLPGLARLPDDTVIDGEVVAADEDLQVLASNNLGEEARSTPAVAGGRMYVRTESTLYCVGPK